LDLLKSTDRCVMCGMCLPHCPTYQLSRDEGESPRGRIALIQGLAGGRLDPTPRLETHLRHCLDCRACEAVCPSGVPYGEIIDGGRALLYDRRPTRPLPPFLNRLVLDRRHRRWAGRLLHTAQRCGLRKLGRALVLPRPLRRLAALLPPLAAQTALQEYYPPQGETRGAVGLFTGCFADLVDRATLHAAVTLLTRFGYGVHVPANQGCCGALHLHHGDAATARSLAAANAAAFNALQLDAVITTASGCGLTMAEYDRYDRPAIKAPVRDISRFIAGLPWPEDLRLAPLNARVAVHDPCSLRGDKAPYRLLQHLPGADVRALPDNGRCCGAAGSYMLREPDTADRLRDDKLTALKSLGADILVTSNLGCALHLRAGLEAAALDIEVMHPIALLKKQIQVASSK
jgi:glycolate oxidase iron-sulfur subunit